MTEWLNSSTTVFSYGGGLNEISANIEPGSVTHTKREERERGDRGTEGGGAATQLIATATAMAIYTGTTPARRDPNTAEIIADIKAMGADTSPSSPLVSSLANTVKLKWALRPVKRPFIIGK